MKPEEANEPSRYTGHHQCQSTASNADLLNYPATTAVDGTYMDAIDLETESVLA